MIRRRGLVAVMFALWPAAVPAQTPLGSEFRLDTRANLGGSYGVARNAAFLPTGEFVVVWGATDMPGGQGQDVRGRIFSASGVGRGAEFTVNASTAGNQSDPEVAVSDSGSFVVVWTSSPAPGISTRIHGQRFDPSGGRLGGEFRVSTGVPNFSDRTASVAAAAGGSFVVVWTGTDGYSTGVLGRRYAPDGTPVGGEFVVNEFLLLGQGMPSVAVDPGGDFVVVWESTEPPGVVRARMFSAAGTALGIEFRVNVPTVGGARQAQVARSRDGAFLVVWHGGAAPNTITGRRFDPSGGPVGDEFTIAFQNLATLPGLAASADGDYAVSWFADDGDSYGAFVRRLDASGAAGPPLLANTYTSGVQGMVSVASDLAGNFLVTWRTAMGGPTAELHGQRYAGGLSAAAMTVDALAGPSSDGNRVLEAGETAAVEPSWLNAGLTAATFTGAGTSFTGPGTAGDPTYTIADGSADYGTAAANATASCTAPGNCYTLGVSVPSVRPALHWDARFHEELSPAALGAAKTWDLHVGDSFSDVPRASPFYRFVETLLHEGVTAGCGGGRYCPQSATTRAQMAAFVILAHEGPGYAPPACVPPTRFADVPAGDPFCDVIEELARRGVVAGCGGDNYCPASGVSREQMAVFVLRTLDPALTPPACAPPNLFADVPETSVFCPWIEELASRGVVTGCGGGNYCPLLPVSREQMSVFLSLTFGLQLYGP